MGVRVHGCMDVWVHGCIARQIGGTQKGSAGVDKHGQIKCDATCSNEQKIAKRSPKDRQKMGVKRKKCPSSKRLKFIFIGSARLNHRVWLWGAKLETEKALPQVRIKESANERKRRPPKSYNLRKKQ